MMKKIAILVVVIFNIFMLVVVLESRFHMVGKLYNSFILDNYNHYLTCDELPDRNYVEKVLAENTDLVDRLYGAGANGIGTGDLEISCENTADIIIFYNGHAGKIAIEKLLGDHTFKGIPVRLKNV